MEKEDGDKRHRGDGGQGDANRLAVDTPQGAHQRSAKPGMLPGGGGGVLPLDLLPLLVRSLSGIINFHHLRISAPGQGMPGIRMPDAAVADALARRL